MNQILEELKAFGTITSVRANPKGFEIVTDKTMTVGDILNKHGLRFTGMQSGKNFRIYFELN